MEKKVALVTGASRGIGQAIANTLGQAGRVVVGTATSEAGAEKITESFKQANIEGQGICLQLAEAESIDKAVQQVVERYGAPSILVNNAAFTQDNILARMKEEQWLEVINVNLTGVYRLTKACLRGMMKARFGRIINMSSCTAFAGNLGQCNYGATKAGVVGFGKSLAHEIATRGITVNAVAPGFIDTDMTKAIADNHREHLLKLIPMQRLGKPEEIANAVAFLASDEASYITGQTLHVNGGMYMA